MNNNNRYQVYAIKSKKDGRIYVGFSSDADKNVKEHNAGHTKSTKEFKPWVLIFKEKVENRKIL